MAVDAKADAYESALNAWKKTRVERLTAENGWLTLCGLWFLEDGAATIGSAAACKIRVPDACPAAVGTLTYAKASGKLSFAPAAGAVVTVAGVPVADAKAQAAAMADLRHDKAKGGGSALEIANAAGGGTDVTLYLIERSGQVAVRGKYKHNAARTLFKGLQSYPVNRALCVDATYRPFPGGPKTVPHPNKVGLVEDEKCPGVVEFAYGGATHALEVIDEDGSDDEWFVIFKDLTSGTETYGMRYVYCAKKPAPGATTVALDFNRAYNPPCSFTPYATCPLATKQNRLPFRVEAGEKLYDADGPATGLGATAAAQAAQAAAKK